MCRQSTVVGFDLQCEADGQGETEEELDCDGIELHGACTILKPDGATITGTCESGGPEVRGAINRIRLRSTTLDFVVMVVAPNLLAMAVVLFLFGRDSSASTVTIRTLTRAVVTCLARRTGLTSVRSSTCVNGCRCCWWWNAWARVCALCQVCLAAYDVGVVLLGELCFANAIWPPPSATDRHQRH